MAYIIGTVKAQFFNTDGTFCAGGFVHAYEAGGGTTEKNTYSTIADALAGTTPNENPVELNQRGEADIVLQGPTRLVLCDSNDAQIWSVDNLNTTTSNVVDSNGHPLLTFVEVANAVNGITITNAVTGESSVISFTGGDSNVSGLIKAKGTGNIELRGTTLALTGNGTVSGTFNCSGLLTAGSLTTTGAVSFLPAGSLIWKASTHLTTGYLECDGAAVSRTTYPALFADIGITYGAGDATTTFNLPNVQRRVLVGRGGSGTATLANTVGATGGEETHTLITAEMPAHTHTQTTYPYNNVFTAGGATGNNATSSGNTGSTGGDGAHNNMQPGLVMMLMIKAF